MIRTSLLLVLTFATTVSAEERYYFVVFASQSRLNNPSKSHVWATVIKTIATDSHITVEEQTISWVPASSNVRLLALRSEEGANLGLIPTIEHYQKLKCRITAWGPYELEPPFGCEFYQRFMQQKARLESGEVRYKALDPNAGRYSRYISDCIHAITDMDPRRGRNAYSEFLRFGEKASEHIVHTLAKRGHFSAVDVLSMQQRCGSEKA